MPRAFIYVVDRDFGFAPNPFHGFCTLATCKPRIRSVAAVGDWIVGMGGGRLRATGKCIFSMRVTKKVSFDDYWNSPEFRDKRPIRNGSMRMLVGDNIYHREADAWHQEDSHHSNEDGSANLRNLQADTRADAALVSSHFYYFGGASPSVPAQILADLGYENRRSHRTYDEARFHPFVEWLRRYPLNQVIADPSDFSSASSRYTGIASRIITA